MRGEERASWMATGKTPAEKTRNEIYRANVSKGIMHLLFPSSPQHQWLTYCHS
jgi:hypothetical protein